MNQSEKKFGSKYPTYGNKKDFLTSEKLSSKK